MPHRAPQGGAGQGIATSQRRATPPSEPRAPTPRATATAHRSARGQKPSTQDSTPLHTRAHARPRAAAPCNTSTARAAHERRAECCGDASGNPRRRARRPPPSAVCRPSWLWAPEPPPKPPAAVDADRHTGQLRVRCAAHV
eukprot:scaffold25929_cov200-Isochrysis_galbana.AAC.2